MGRRLGPNMKAGVAAINGFDQETIAQIEKSNAYTLDLNGTQYEITLEDLEILSEDIPGWQVATDRDITVALDIQLDEELIAEGTARELVNRIQNIRKSKDFNITDRIGVKVTSGEKVDQALSKFGNYISNEVLANSIQSEQGLGAGEEVELFEGEKVWIEVIKD